MIASMIFILLLTSFGLFITPSCFQRLYQFLKSIGTLRLDVTKAFTFTTLNSLSFIFLIKEVSHSLLHFRDEFSKILPLVTLHLFQHLVEIFCNQGKRFSQVRIIIRLFITRILNFACKAILLSSCSASSSSQKFLKNQSTHPISWHSYPVLLQWL